MKHLMTMSVFLMLLMPMASMAAEFAVFRMGGMEVVALADVNTDSPSPNRPDLLVGLDGAQAEKYLVPGAMANSINCFVVKLGGRTILFDTGFGVGRGLLLESLHAAGLAPEDIDAVCITHFHGDHVGGLVREGKAAFPRAHLYYSRVEREGNPGDSGLFLPVYDGRATAFEFGQEILPGVTPEDTRGHTPGHTVFLLRDGTESLAVIGDLIHFPGVQLPLPDVAVTYDSDPVQAVAARKAAFDRFVTENIPVASMHMPFPAVGRLGRANGGYSFTPAR